MRERPKLREDVAASQDGDELLSRHFLVEVVVARQRLDGELHVLAVGVGELLDLLLHHASQFQSHARAVERLALAREMRVHQVLDHASVHALRRHALLHTNRSLRISHEGLAHILHGHIAQTRFRVADVQNDNLPLLKLAQVLEYQRPAEHSVRDGLLHVARRGKTASLLNALQAGNLILFKVVGNLQRQSCFIALPRKSERVKANWQSGRQWKRRPHPCEDLFRPRRSSTQTGAASRKRLGRPFASLPKNKSRICHLCSG